MGEGSFDDGATHVAGGAEDLEGLSLAIFAETGCKGRFVQPIRAAELGFVVQVDHSLRAIEVAGRRMQRMVTTSRFPHHCPFSDCLCYPLG